MREKYLRKSNNVIKLQVNYLQISLKFQFSLIWTLEKNELKKNTFSEMILRKIWIERFSLFISVKSDSHLKGTLMQIWKSPHMFVFIWKKYVEGFTSKHLLLFEINTRMICEKFVCKHSETIEYVKSSLLLKKFTNFTRK